MSESHYMSSIFTCDKCGKKTETHTQKFEHMHYLAMAISHTPQHTPQGWDRDLEFLLCEACKEGGAK